MLNSTSQKMQLRTMEAHPVNNPPCRKMHFTHLRRKKGLSFFEGFKGAITADWILLAKGPVRRAFPATAIQDKIPLRPHSPNLLAVILAFPPSPLFL